MRFSTDARAAARGRRGPGRPVRLLLSLLLPALVPLGAAASTSSKVENNFVLTPDLDDVTTCVQGGIVTLSLVLENPINRDFGDGEARYVDLVGGCEFRLTGSGSAAVGVVTPAAPGRMVSDNGDYAITYDAPLPVSWYQWTVLATVTVLMVDSAADPVADPPAELDPCDGANGAVYLTAPTGATVPGAMVYFDAEDPVDPAVEVTTWYFPPDAPVLLLVPDAVPTRGRAWGTLKAQYR